MGPPAGAAVSDEGAPAVDEGLLARFREQMYEKVPHPDESAGTSENGGVPPIACPTPLVDLTDDLLECAEKVFNADLSDTGIRVFGKLDGGLPSGSIKVRPAVHIIHDAIRSGRLRGGQTVIEATSGNFGIALGRIARLGLPVVALVSRRLQEGVLADLRKEGIHVMDLDMDICPAPGAKGSREEIAARASAANVRSQLQSMGFDPAPFDGVSDEAVGLLAAQDVINLAKLIAGAYGMFCPEQYDNELNIEAHRTVTGPEIDGQLRALRSGDGSSLTLGGVEIVCTFGTGGTSGGLARYAAEKYSTRPVHVVFPKGGQDVAGIRTRANATGLRLYRPDEYTAEHEVDFAKAARLLEFFAERGRDIGESSALALYAVLLMASFEGGHGVAAGGGAGGGGGRTFVVIVADGVAKYENAIRERASAPAQPAQVSVEQAAAEASSYGKVVWVHMQYAPREEGIEMLASSLGVDRSKIVVPTAGEAREMITTRQVPDSIREAAGGGKVLCVCMAGNTSMAAAGVLAGKGMAADSLEGGITGLPAGAGRSPGEYVRAAAE